MQTWCQERQVPTGGVLTLDTAWRLAVAWYHDRLEPTWRRKTLAQTQQLFSELGMTSEFWRLGE